MGMDTMYLRSSEELRTWFAEHSQAQELWVGFYKRVPAKRASRTPRRWTRRCRGSIDGVRYGVDDRRYRNRFTPRRPGSNWSQVNIRRVEELRGQGRMLPAGEAVFAARNEKRMRSTPTRTARENWASRTRASFASTRRRGSSTPHSRRRTGAAQAGGCSAPSRRSPASAVLPR